jgi:RND family efflux transporter MFP subunit
MKLNKIIITAIILFASIGFYSCGKNGESKTDLQTKQLTNVKVMDISPKSFTDNFNVVGVIKPYASAKVSSEEGGLILSVVKDKGDYVSRGQVVVRLKKDVENASLESALAQVELAKLNFEKQEQLYRENATTEIAYRTALLQLDAAEKGLDVIRTHISKGFVRSPINGVVDNKFMNNGEMSAPGLPIISIVDVSRVKISAGVPESHIKDVRLGQGVKITIDVLPGAEFEGQISYIAPTLSNQTRTFEIEIVINNPNRILKPEMNATVDIAKFQMSDAIVLPQDMIVDNGDEKYVFILEGDIARRREITTGGREGNAVLITSGLNIGDKIISEGFQSVVDGEKVQVVQ